MCYYPSEKGVEYILFQLYHQSLSISKDLCILLSPNTPH
jgi:hypothetical protein